LALLIIEGKASFHPAFTEKQCEKDVFETYKALCEANGHEPASSELGAYDKKE
jgi:hypothetical protein